VRKRPRLRLVSEGEGDATSIFDDVDKLRDAFEAPSPRSSAQPEGPLRSRRPREVETFARIPHDRAMELYRRRIGDAAWAALIELDRMILAQRGKNPVCFWSPRLRDAGLTKHTRKRALQRLEAAGVVTVEQRGRGLGPLVTHLWYPLRN
jgi:hypothetical protein